MQKGTLLKLTIRNFSQVVDYAARITHVKDHNSFIVAGDDSHDLPALVSPRLIHLDEVGKSAVLQLSTIGISTP